VLKVNPEQETRKWLAPKPIGRISNATCKKCGLNGVQNRGNESIIMNQVLPAEGNAVLANDLETIKKINYITLVKGFSRVFWGLALTAVLFLSQVKLELFSGLRLPAYFIGTALHCWGLLTLRNAGKISARWSSRLMLAILLALSQIYFFPFVCWWKTMPYISFFTFNVGALAAAVILSLYLSNIIVADFFRCLSLKGERLEAQIYAGAVVAFMAVPLIVAVVFASISAVRYQTIFLDELIEAVHRVPLWLYVIVTVPCSLTLAVLWKARDRSYQQFCHEKDTINPPRPLATPPEEGNFLPKADPPLAERS